MLTVNENVSVFLCVCPKEISNSFPYDFQCTSKVRFFCNEFDETLSV